MDSTTDRATTDGPATEGLTADRLAEIRRDAERLATVRRKLDQVDRGPWMVGAEFPPGWCPKGELADRPVVSSPMEPDVFADPDPKVCAFVALARNVAVEGYVLELVGEVERLSGIMGEER